MSPQVSCTSPVKLRLLDRAIQWVSVATIVWLPIMIVLRHCCGVALPVWLGGILIPIATAGAIGYLTNYCAIWMLFKPYLPHGLIPQGVIPANQHRLAKSVSLVISERLLKPEMLAQAVGGMLGGVLHDPLFVANLRAGLQEMILEELKGEKTAGMIDRLAAELCGNPERRVALAEGLANALKRQVPGLLPAIREQISTGVKEYVRTKVPGMFAGMVMPMVDGFIENLDWNQVGDKISSALFTAEARDALADEIGKMVDALREKIPSAVESLVRDDALWLAMEECALPKFQALVASQLEANAEKIVENLHIAEQIEEAIVALPVKEMHLLVLDVSGRELTLLQVLGYFLGIIAGTLLIFCH